MKKIYAISLRIDGNSFVVYNEVKSKEELSDYLNKFYSGMVNWVARIYNSNENVYEDLDLSKEDITCAASKAFSKCNYVACIERNGISRIIYLYFARKEDVSGMIALFYDDVKINWIGKLEEFENELR